MTPTTLPPPTPAPAIDTLADFLDRLGNVPLHRVRFHPAPGTATEADVLVRPDGAKRLYELVDGTLVEKAMGWYESWLASLLIGYLLDFLKQHDRGIVVAGDRPIRLAPGLVRFPDVAFISWDHFPDRILPAEQIATIPVDLAAEILSPSNTADEMARKRREYFAAGTRLVWEVEPELRNVTVYTAPEQRTIVTVDQCLDGGPVLPGFTLSVREWFERAGQRRSP